MAEGDKDLITTDQRSLLPDKESDDIGRLPFEKNIIEIGRIIGTNGQPDRIHPDKLTRSFRAGNNDSIYGFVDLTQEAFNPYIGIIETDPNDPAVQLFAVFYELDNEIEVSIDLTSTPEAIKLWYAESIKDTGDPLVWGEKAGSCERGEQVDSNGKKCPWVKFIRRPEQFSPKTVQFLNSKTETLLKAFQSAGAALLPGQSLQKA